MREEIKYGEIFGKVSARIIKMANFFWEWAVRKRRLCNRGLGGNSIWFSAWQSCVRFHRKWSTSRRYPRRTSCVRSHRKWPRSCRYPRTSWMLCMWFSRRSDRIPLPPPGYNREMQTWIMARDTTVNKYSWHKHQESQEREICNDVGKFSENSTRLHKDIRFVMTIENAHENYWFGAVFWRHTPRVAGRRCRPFDNPRLVAWSRTRQRKQRKAEASSAIGTAACFLSISSSPPGEIHHEKRIIR